MITEFLDNLNKESSRVKLSTSYYPNETSELNKDFIGTLLAYDKRIDGVTVVMTSETIGHIIKGDETFKWLYDSNYNIQLDYYTPNSASEMLMPSDLDLYNFFTYLKVTAPKIELIDALSNGNVSHTSCASPNKSTVLPNGEVIACKYDISDNDRYLVPICQRSNENIILSFMNQNSCLSCEFYKRRNNFV